MYTHIHMCTCSVTTAHNPFNAFMGIILCFVFIPLFFFACYTTPRRTSFHSTFWTYLPFCASYKYLGCLSLSLLLTWDDFACQLACKWLCRCCWPAKVLYEMREVPRKSGKKSRCCCRCCCRCCLKPTHKAKQNKVQPSNNKSSEQTRPEIAAAQRRADPQPHSSSGCGLQRWWLRGTRARSDDPMTKRRQHTRTCGRLGLAKRRRCRCRCRCRSVGCGVNDLRPANWLAELWCALRKSQNYCGARRGLGLNSSLI